MDGSPLADLAARRAQALDEIHHLVVDADPCCSCCNGREEWQELRDQITTIIQKAHHD